MSTDSAYVTPVMILRPSSFGRGAFRPRSALVVRFPGTPAMREAVLRGLLGQGWQLAAAPVGEFEAEDVPRAQVYLDAAGVRVEAGGEIVFEGPLGLHAGPEGHTWTQLARAVGEVMVLLTVGPDPVLDEDDANRAARAGHLVGIAGTVFQTTPDGRYETPGDAL